MYRLAYLENETILPILRCSFSLKSHMEGERDTDAVMAIEIGVDDTDSLLARQVERNPRVNREQDMMTKK